ncbi:MAG: PD40 domain-containing protein, partial [Armatimonadetes bacterium]|nr:PD40 domain-containing protein [Armatimonadota bacterium]
VFNSIRDGNYEIYSMNSDGTSQIRLTNSATDDDFPSYSPDGNKIVFSSSRDGNYEIYSMNSDGTNPTRLTNSAGGDLYPSYSPDGNKIIFSSIRDGNYEIYSMNTSGSGLVRLTTNSADDFTSVKSSFGTFGYATSKLLGTDGAFGTAGGGFLLGQKGATTTSVVTFDSAAVANRANLRVAAQTLADTTASNLVFTVTASDSLGSLKFYNEFATAAPTVATVVPVTLPTGTTGVVVSFDAATGKVATVLPYAANRGAGSAKSMQSGDTITYTGSFSGVWSGDGDNKAPSGASTVRLDAKTGVLLGFD